MSVACAGSNVKDALGERFSQCVGSGGGSVNGGNGCDCVSDRRWLLAEPGMETLSAGTGFRFVPRLFVCLPSGSGSFFPRTG